MDGGGDGSVGGGDVSSSTPAADAPAPSSDSAPAAPDTSTSTDSSTTSPEPGSTTPSASDQSLPAQVPATSATKRDPRTLLTKALDALQVGKKKKLDKVVELAKKEGKISNDDVQLALRVSHATATRYLVQLTKEGRLKRVGSAENAVYEPA